MQTNDNKPKKPETEELKEGVIAGRNAVLEAIRSRTPIEKLFLAKGDTEGSILSIRSTALRLGIPIQETDKHKLQFISGVRSHQGVVAYVAQKEYCSVEDILAAARKKGEKPFIILLDELSDPHNFGAVIRSAEACGAHGIVIPKHRGVGVTPVVSKTSAGAYLHVNIAKVGNLVAAMEQLKKEGVWLYGCDASAKESLYGTDLTGSFALVIGSEGQGLSRLVKEKCDFLISIPMSGKVSSLNASVAAAVCMFEAVRQRNGQQ